MVDGGTLPFFEIKILVRVRGRLKASTRRKENVMIIGTVVVFVIVMVLLFPFLAWALSTFNIFFTTCPSGNAKFVMRGETAHALIVNHEDLEIHLQKKWLLEPKLFKKRKRLFFGLFWVGIPGVYRIHLFPITKDQENPDAGEDPKTWVIQHGEILVDSLRLVIQRSFVFRNIELKDRSVVNVLITTKLRVLDWFIPVFNLKGKFFENTAGLIEAEVGDEFRKLTLQELIEAKKGEDAGILSGLKLDGCEFSTALKEQVGLDLEGIAISRVDPGDAKLREAMNAKVLAQKEGEATNARAEADAKAAITKAQAEADALLLIAKAEQAKLQLLGLLKISANGTILLVPDARTKAYTDALSQLKELRVIGEGAFPFVDVGGKK
jgi:hypothetical protein